MIGIGLEPNHHFRILGRDVQPFTHIHRHVIELRLLDFYLLVLARNATFTLCLILHASIGVRELKFPLAVTADDRLQLILLIVKRVELVGVLGIRLVANHWPDIEAVDLVLR